MENDANYDENDERKDKLTQNYSLEYMEKAIAYYDATDPNTGKKKHSQKSFHPSFKNIPDRRCLSHFRIYISAHGTKKMKLDEIDEFTYAHFQKAREQLLSIHNIDLKRLALKKAREVHDDTFVAREH